MEASGQWPARERPWGTVSTGNHMAIADGASLRYRIEGSGLRLFLVGAPLGIAGLAPHASRLRTSSQSAWSSGSQSIGQPARRAAAALARGMRKLDASANISGWR